MERLYGAIDKIKIVQYSSTPLVRFSLNDVNCLIANHSLNFLADVEEKMNITIFGYYNSRKQFVVKKYKLNSKPKIVVEFEKSIYPNKKPY
ncbi:hypothetical protein ACOYX0_11270 [Enterococcus thailandicus]|uniref:hypothetical protein n=1 Tax=Enterococcus TaxID=1350 RepID=UPI002890B2B1|nr:hypothetical protein [Enterococcus thailandicus]MDT2752190.1 hypothetical protein [Enterococcus thailandicus]MDT2776683.1 hypothetical protein [Enterococcus thailandicus]MDT2793497.1 hypothetical protein [Enterococcus thailandicus]